MTRVFCDIHGVLACFTRPAWKIHGCGLEPPDWYADPRLWPKPGQWDMHPWMGISEETFWSRLRHEGFWSGLPWTPDGQAIYGMLHLRFPGQLCALSSPRQEPAAFAGTVLWVKKHLPLLHERYLLGPDKGQVAGPGTLLIDDADRNVDRFREMGGSAILLPRAWNSRHAEAHRAVDALAADLRKWDMVHGWEGR